MSGRSGHPEGSEAAEMVRTKLEEYFWEWLSLPESQKLVQQAVQSSKAGSKDTSLRTETPKASLPSPPPSPTRRTPLVVPDDDHSGTTLSSPVLGPSSPQAATGGGGGKSLESAGLGNASLLSASVAQERPSGILSDSKSLVGELSEPHAAGHQLVGSSMLASGSKTIPRFWSPKIQKPTELLTTEVRNKIHEQFVEQDITAVTTYQQLEPIVSHCFGLSKYFAAPLLQKLKAFYDIEDEAGRTKQAILAPSSKPITEQMLVEWCQGKVQADDQIVTFYWFMKKEQHGWIEREDFAPFLTAVLMTHPGLDFLRETTEFQIRYADTVISRIFFVYDRKDVGRIYLRDLRRYKPSIVETWKQLSEQPDIKMVRDYFSYEHFYVMYCTFWELDSDHDFLLDKDDLLKYDGHALSRRAIERIFSEIPTKFTSAVPGKMGYEDFIHFLLCDQDRQTDRSVEYWFHLFDLDGDGCIRDHEIKYFYEEQMQRMECLNYETISFADLMCQMNDMLFPRTEGQFRLSDFKRKKKFAGTFFSLFSSLNKFLTFEHRDPFLVKQEQMDNPNFSDWDRFCANEYLRLAMEDGDEGEEDNTR